MKVQAIVVVNLKSLVVAVSYGIAIVVMDVSTVMAIAIAVTFMAGSVARIKVDSD